MVKWYDRIGNPIEMRVGKGWIKGTVIDGERTGDGIINMKTADEKKYWCGVGTEGVWFRKCNNSLGDLFTQGDKIRSMSDEELAKWLTKVTNDAQRDARTKCDYQWGEWLKSEVKE